ncbi:MAG: preprotein translocase subunit SecG [Flavobacteriales bacterium]|jgi:protein translocase SecG subunit
MATFIIVLIIIVSLLLGGIVLLQNPKGGGLAVGFQGSTQIGGVQRTADFLEKATWYLAIALFVLCLSSAAFYTPSTPPPADTATPTEQADGAAAGDGQEQPAQ